MASPQYSTPYSQLSYPSYTPLSVLPVKQQASPGWSGISSSSSNPRSQPMPSCDTDLRLLKAAVRKDVSLHQGGTAPHARDRQPSGNTGWPAPATAGGHADPSLGSALLSRMSTRTNAPLYAPQPSAALPSAPARPTSTIRYSDIDRVRSFSAGHAAARSQRGAAQAAAAVVVSGTEVDAESDVVCAAEAVPYLCAFQEECQSLLALLNTAPAAGRVSSYRPSPPPQSFTPPTLPDALPPAPFQPALPPPVMQPQTYSDVAHCEATRAPTAPLRPAPAPPIGLGVASPPVPTSAPVPSAEEERKEVNILPGAAAPPTAPPLDASSLSPVAAVPVPKSPAAVPSATYAQLVQEMDELASLLHHEGEENTGSEGGACTPAHESSAAPLASIAASEAAHRDTPEKQKRPTTSAKAAPREKERAPSLTSSRLSPSVGELVAPTAPPAFWSSQCLPWLLFLLEKKQNTLRRIQAFEDTRAPQRRGAGARGADIDATTTTSAAGEGTALRVAGDVLRLLRSVHTKPSDAAGWAVRQQRHICTQISNLLAELTSAEDEVVANLLNDAAAGATMEREGTAKLDATSAAVAELSGRKTSAAAPSQLSPPTATALPVEYRRDMLETLALLEKMSQENKALKLQVADAQDSITRLRDEARQERNSKNEVAEHFDRIAAQNSDLTAQLREAKRQLHEAEVKERPNPPDDALREQLERQGQHLRDLRGELDVNKGECDALRRTVLQLRDALVRHRAVIDLLTRHRRERQHGAGSASQVSGSRQASPRFESPPMQLIEDILSGVREAPSSTASLHSSSDTGSGEDDATYDVSDDRSSDTYRI